MNFVVILGRLGKDAEKRFTSTNQQVVSFNVATNSKRSGKEETMWWRVSCWGDQWDKILPYLKKGSAVIVNGEITKIDTYTDKEGRVQVSVDIRAESIRFNPFGGGSNEKQGDSNSTNQYNQKPAQEGFSGFNQDNPFANQGYTLQGQGQGGFSASHDTNEVPF